MSNAEQTAVDAQEGIAMTTAEDMTPKKDEYKHWIKMSHEEMVAAQKAEVLIGYDAIRGLGLVKAKETKKK